MICAAQRARILATARACFLVSLAVLAWPSGTFGLANPQRNAVPLSPGNTTRYAPLETNCPTFSWARSEGAAAQRLVIFGYDPSLGQLAESPRLEVDLPRTAGSWTPQGEQCLNPGRYAWAVGTIGKSGESGWSEPLLIESSAGPSNMELARALRAVEGYLASRNDLGTKNPGRQPTRSRSSGQTQRSGTEREWASDRGAGVTAAIRGDVSTIAGEAYGLHGVAASSQGAGVIAENSAGPDIVLAGPEPASLSETGLQRSSSGTVTFDITNPGAGTMELRVDGVPVTNIETDQDTLANLACAGGAVPKFDGNSWGCGLDLDTDTTYAAGYGLDLTGTTFAADLTELQERVGDSCPVGQSIRLIHSNGDVECEVDDEASYTFGPGVVLQGNTVSIEPSFFTHRWSNVDTYAIDPSVAVGAQPSMARLPSGHMVVAYATGDLLADEDLMIASCLDPLCSSATVEPLVETLSNIGDTFAIAVGSDGLPIVAYSDTGANYDLIVAHCNNVQCSSATHTTIDSTMDSTDEKAIVIGSDGLALIAYFDTTNDNLKVAHCQNVSCTSAILSTIDQVGDVGRRLSMALGADDRGVISYLDAGAMGTGPYDLKVAHCNDILCNTATTNTVETVGSASSFETSISIGDDDLPIIAYNWPGLAYMRAAHCHDVTCATSSRNTIATDARNSVSITVAADGLPRVFFRKHTSPTALRMVRCMSVDCFASSESTLDDGMSNLYGTEAVMGSDGLPLVAVGTARSNGINALYSVEIVRIGLSN